MSNNRDDKVTDADTIYSAKSCLNSVPDGLGNYSNNKENRKPSNKHNVDDDNYPENIIETNGQEIKSLYFQIETNNKIQQKQSSENYKQERSEAAKTECSLISQCDELKNNLENVTKSLQRTEKDLETERNRRESERNDMMEQIVLLENKRDDYEQQIKALKAANTYFESSSYAQTSHIIEHYEKTMISQENQIKDLNKTIENHEKNISDLHSEMHDLEKIIGCQQESVFSLHDRRLDLEEVCEDHEENISNLNNQIHELAKVCEDHEENISNLNNQIHELEEKIKNLEN